MKTRHYTIGVDIGGTNTDAVMIDYNQKIVATIKTETKADIQQGFQIAVSSLLQKTDIPPQSIKEILLGTTQATNAILENKDLYRVGVIRIAGQRPDAMPSCYLWPFDLKNNVLVGTETIEGGWECDGKPITRFQHSQAREAIQKLRDKGAESLAIIGVFSPLNQNQEEEVAACVQDIPVSLSSETGSIGFIERENSAILNAALKKVMAKGFHSLKSACQSLQLNCPLFITQNDGSLITLKRAMEYPVLTISAGQTNSFRGAAKLTNCDNAIVVDIGGTSTDIGIIRHGFPKRSFNASSIGGIRLNFPVPDVLSIGLGGGSCISFDKTIQIGPKSVGRELMRKGQAFGGNQLTLTDAALSSGYIRIGNAAVSSISLTQEKGIDIIKQASDTLQKLITTVRRENEQLPVIFVGGGASLFPINQLDHRFIIPSNFSVANAYGAALSEISGTVDTVVSLMNRNKVLKQLREQAYLEAIKQGADKEKIRIIDQQIIPYHYIPNEMARVIIRASGASKTPYSQA